MEKMGVKNIIILGMHPHTWENTEIADTVRLMAKTINIHNKIFVNPSIGFRHALSQRQPLQLTWVGKEYNSIYVITPPLEIIPSSFGLGKIKNRFIMKILNRKVCSLLGPQWREQTILYLSSGGIAQSFSIMESLKPKWLIFDVLDDNIGFPGTSEKEKTILKNQFTQIMQKATLITTVSKYLVNKLSEEYNCKAQFLPNGLDIGKFVIKPTYTQPLSELLSLERPLFGFVGAITSWIDLGLLLKAADYLTKGTIVIVGSVIESAVSKDSLDKLCRHPRLSFLGPKPYFRVPHFLHQFDVLLLPRNYEPHSLASDPLKLYEYLATGKPIVSTAIPSAMRFSNVAYVCDSDKGFLNALDRAQKDWTPEKAVKAQNSVKDLTWENRAKEMLVHFRKKQLIK
ncbi:MAG: glycosyltransferase [Peptococcaceae bacterium]|nr:glycosyltransferase [Candidatus Syntrophopropionicum ammoniitolerans]